MVMELIDKIKPLLGTKTILIIDSKSHWLQIYKLLRLKVSAKFLACDYNSYSLKNPLCIIISQKGYESKADLLYFQTNYKNYKFIHTSDLIEFNNWLWN